MGPTTFNLVIEAEDGDVTLVRVTEPEVTIGRSQSNTVCLPEQNVSRRHARLYHENGSRFVEDTNSANGILLNGAPLTGRAEIHDGDNLQIGDYLIGVRAEGQGVESIEDTDRLVLPGGKADTASTPASKPARFVLTSAGFEGKEVRLEQDLILIGRQSDNDVVLEHWSIWPHHARLTRDEKGTFVIEDLRPKSVRIDGKQQERAELCSGNLVELGKVHMRFVAAGEEHAYKPARAALSRSTLWLAAGIGVVVLGGTLLSLRAVTRPRAKTPPAAAPAPPPPSLPAAELRQVDEAIAAEEWEKAIDLCQRLEPLDRDGECQRRRARAEKERQAQGVFLAFREAAERGDVDDAVDRYQNIDDDSVYRGQAEVLWPVVRDAYSQTHLAKAAKAAAQGNCDEARSAADRVAAVDAENTGLAAIRRRCPDRSGDGSSTVTPASARRPPAAPAQRPAPPKPRPAAAEGSDPVGTAGTDTGPAKSAPEGAGASDKATSAGGEGGASKDSPAAQAAALVEEAEQLYVQGQYARAVQRAQKALKLQPDESKAISIIGVSSCNLKDRDKAAWAYERLNTTNRPMLVYVCQQNGITLP